MNIRHSVVKTFDTCVTSKAVVYYGIPVCVQLYGNLSSDYIEGLKKLSLEEKPLTDLDIRVSDEDLSQTAKEMFPNNDVSGNEFYARTIPIGVAGGIITPQIDSEGNTVFNGEGSISLAEVLDGLNAIFYGCNSNQQRKKSLDNISDVSDYFNEGYNLLCTGYSAPFYNLYRRDELLRPITRIELAYILVVCSGIFGSIYEGAYKMGVSFNWLRPYLNISSFADWNKYKVSLMVKDNRLVSDIKEYKDTRSMSDYISDIQDGMTAIPLPMMMSLLELGVQGLFYFEGMKLSPLRQVTRGEVCYLITKLAGKE